MDNWRDYFEIVEVLEFNENAFGEVDNLEYYRYYCLNDEYVNVTAQSLSDIAIEYIKNTCVFSCVVDPINQTFALGEKIRDWNVTTKTEKMQYPYHSEISNRIGFKFIYDYISRNEIDNGATIDYADDVVMNRIKGTLYILK